MSRRKWEPAFFDPDTGTEIPGPEKYVLDTGIPNCESHESMFAVFHHQVKVANNVANEYPEYSDFQPSCCGTPGFVKAVLWIPSNTGILLNSYLYLESMILIL